MAMNLLPAKRMGRAAAALALAALLGAGSSPVFAEKMVIFKNGKILRAKTIKSEKGWTRIELDGGNIIGVRSAQIGEIEDLAGAGGGPKADSLPNQAVAGSGGGGAYSAGPSYQPPPQGGGEEGEQAPPDQNNQQPPNPAPTTVGAPAIPGLAPLNQPASPATRGFRRFRSSGSGSATSGAAASRQGITGPDQSLKGNPRTSEDDDE